MSVGAVQRWRPPSGSVYKVNFDASVLQALIPLAGPSVSTSEEAEVLACRKALELAVDAGFRDVTEGDNSAVMKAILSSPRARWSRLGHLYDDISCPSVGFGCIKFECVRRSANNVAHMLARSAKSGFFFFFFRESAKSVDVESSVWLEEPPFPALEALSLDLNFLND